MKRKLIKQGGGGCVIYVPKKWLDSHNLIAGNELNIEENENSLILSSDELSLKKKEISISIINENEQFIRINLNNLYRLGYDIIKINYKNKKQLSIIDDLTKNVLLGFEITEINDDFLIIESITEPGVEKQKILLRKIFFLIIQSFELLNEDLTTNKCDNFSKIKEYSNNVYRYNNFCRRVISKNKFEDNKSHLSWRLYAQLNLLQRSLLHFYEIMSKENKLKFDKKIIEIFSKLKESFSILNSGFFKHDFEDIENASIICKELLYNNIHNELKINSGINSISLYYAGEISRQINLLLVPMIGLLYD